MIKMAGVPYSGKHLLALSVALMVITGAPYFYAYLNTPPGGAYTGLHALTPGDFNVYFSQIRQAAEGTLSTHNLFSGMEGIGSISMMNPLWYALGVLGAAFHLSPPLTFHLARLLLIPFFLIALWQLVILMVPNHARYTAGAMVLFSSGIGYFLLPFLTPGVERDGVYLWPMDLWVPESNTFLTLYHSPHLLLALILFVWILVCFFRAQTASRPFLWQLMGGFSAAALFAFHPFHAITLAFVLGAWAFVLGRASLRKSFETLLVFIGLSTPSIGWQVGRIITDEITLDWVRQNITPLPPLWALVAGFGFLIPLAVVGFLSSPRNGARASFGSRTYWLLAAWALVQLILALSPFPFQRRLLQGIHIPLALLAGVGITAFINLLPRSPMLRSFAMVALWFILVSSTVGAVSRDFALFFSRDPHFYLSAPLRQILYALETGPRDRVVLAGLTTGSFVPAWTGRSVYAAPGAHSLHYDVERRVRAYWFLLGKGTRTQRAQFLLRERISEVVITPLDSIDASLLTRDSLLRVAYDREGVSYFTVRFPLRYD